MYPDVFPASRLAAAPTPAEVNARVSALVAARQAAAALVHEANAGADKLRDADQPLQLLSHEAFTVHAKTRKDSSSNIEVVPKPPNQEGGLLWLLRNLLCLGTSFMVLYIAMKGAVNLQSSVFAEVGLGTAGLTSYYAGFLTSNLFLPTFIIRWLGCKMTVIVTILAYGPYILAQLWARFYTLVPGGLLAGLAAGPMWVAQGTYLSHLARVHTNRQGANAEPEDVLMVRLFGIFYMLYQMSQVWGNLVSSAVLSQGISMAVELNGTREICGANFCAASSQSAMHLAHDKPSDSQIATITFVYITCIVVAALIVVFGVDPIPRSQGKSRKSQSQSNLNQEISVEEIIDFQSDKIEEELSKSTAVILSNGSLLVSSGLSDSIEKYVVNNMSHKSRNNSFNNGVANYGSNGVSNVLNNNLISNGTASKGVGMHGPLKSDGRVVEIEQSNEVQEESAWSVLCATIKLTSHVDLLLLVPITAFLGVEDTFLAADYTASYVSCAWGIRYIGYVMICYGVLNSTAALCGGWLVKLTGRLPVVLGGAVLQTAVVAALRVWKPHPNDTTLFFTMAGLWGITDGIWQAQINAMYGILFPGQEEAAYSSFRLWEGVGYIIAYSYSSYLCTDYKLYTLLFIMIIGVCGYTTDEWRLRRRSKREPLC